MTTVARQVLADLEAAHIFLELEDDPQHFKVLWVAAVSLARAVGHVLQKVDAQRSQHLSSAVTTAYAGWKRAPARNEIFWSFIEDERNSLLKQYEIGYFPGPVDVTLEPGSDVVRLGDQLFCPMEDGPYAGEDCRDVLGEATIWWREQLDAIDLASSSGSRRDDNVSSRSDCFTGHWCI